MKFGLTLSDLAHLSRELCSRKRTTPGPKSHRAVFTQKHNIGPKNRTQSAADLETLLSRRKWIVELIPAMTLAKSLAFGFVRPQG